MLLTLLCVGCLQEGRAGKYLTGDELSHGDLAVFCNLSTLQSGWLDGAHCFNLAWLVLHSGLLLQLPHAQKLISLCCTCNSTNWHVTAASTVQTQTSVL
jgi:hypothetical protein